MLGFLFIIIRISGIYNKTNYYPYPWYTTKQITIRISGIYNKTNCYPYIRDIQQNKLLSVSGIYNKTNYLYFRSLKEYMWRIPPILLNLKSFDWISQSKNRANHGFLQTSKQINIKTEFININVKLVLLGPNVREMGEVVVLYTIKDFILYCVIIKSIYKFGLSVCLSVCIQ